MNPNNELENIDSRSQSSTIEESATVDDFIKELEAKEKDLHITADTTFIEIAPDFDDGEVPEYLRGDFSPGGQIFVLPTVSTLPETGRDDDFDLETQISELKNKITALETEGSELSANSHRRAKDFEAYKARSERERSETFVNQLSNLAVKMLPALDNLDRALKFASDMPEAKRNKFIQFFEGIVLVNQQINEVLANMGIVQIDTVGTIFDPHFHEAVAIEESCDFPPNMISEELIRGYRIGEKVIRHSMVKVSKPLPTTESSKAVDGKHADAISNGACPEDEIEPFDDIGPETDGQTSEDE